MKKYFLFALMALSLASCEEDVTINTPAFEAMNNYTFWRAAEKSATVSNGNLILVGADESTNVTIEIKGYEIGKDYALGTAKSFTATYKQTIENVTYTYKTTNTLGSGLVKLASIDKQKPGTISGTFLIEFSPEGNSMPNHPKIHLNKGVFFQIPLKDKVVPPTPETPTP